MRGKARSHRVDCAGKTADIVVLRGDPTQDIKRIEEVEIVFKDGVAFDTVKLTESVLSLPVSENPGARTCA